VDLFGPWTLSIGNKKLKFHALTIIDMVTNVVEIIHKKTAAHVYMHFENTWISGSPRPLNCIHDQGSKFVGYEFREMLDEHHINDRPTSAKNPPANSVC
jgi:hypothetical protein